MMRKIDLSFVKGKHVSLSRARITLSDFSYFGRETTKVTIAREINVTQVLDAFRASAQPLSWAAVFMRTFALVAVAHPQLRRVYLKWPFARLCEYPHSVASIAVERVDADERILVFGKIHEPEKLPIHAVVGAINQFKAAPLEELQDYRLQSAVAFLPRPIRYLLWWLGLNIGVIRPTIFGTFGFSTVASFGAEIEYFVQPVGYVLTCGPISEEAKMTVRLSFDHRVIDGADVARALICFEEILNNEIASEIR